jgi:predicted N-acetyltransferase YhbS
MRIDYLSNWDACIEQLAAVQFEQWGPLTGRDNLEQYKALLRGAGKRAELFTSLVAVEEDNILGSVNLVKNDLPVRRELTPWLAQLYVFPESRCKGVGAALVQATVGEAKRLNRSTLYLYCAGTLPEFYKKLGWCRTDELEYQGKTRVIMAIAADA